MGISFTPQQEKIIKVRDCNILVSAAAGSGKTAVLVERIIQRICDAKHPVDVDRILVVTFTNAAAAQMRERIRKAIDQRIKEEPNNSYLQRQSALLHNAQITTIHQFCLFVIRNHFYTIGLDPVFRVADESELKLLKNKVMKQLMEEKFEEGNENFIQAIEYYCLKGKEEKLEQLIYQLNDFAMSYPFPHKWLQGCREDYRNTTTKAFEESKMGLYFQKFLKQRIEDFIILYAKIIEIAQLPDGPYMYGELLDGEIEQLEKIARCTGIEGYRQGIEQLIFGRLPSKKDDSVDPQKRELAKQLRNQVKEGIGKLKGQFFSIAWETEWERQEVCGIQLANLMELVEEYQKLFSNIKREKKIIDFHDIEHFALEILLGDKKAAKEYQDYFEEIYIDEYQDSNLVQEYLLKAVSKEAQGDFNRFMVGDVKQSIYRFRLAKPTLFLEKYNTYDITGGPLRRIDLSQNFRSRKEVLEATNIVFEKIMTEAVGGICYDENAALYPAAKYPENEACKSEVIFVEKPDKEKMNAKEFEALVIAQKIKKLKKEFLVVDEETGETRQLRYSDVVILLRSTSGWDEAFRRVLMEEGIPTYILSKTGYFEVVEIQTILQYLKVLDNPIQDIPLYASLLSIFGGFSEEEVANLRSGAKNLSLYQCIKNAQETCEKCKSFLAHIEYYRKESVFLSASQLLQKIIGDFHYITYVSALPGGEQRKANVEMLFEKVKNIEKTNSYGLYYLSRYMEQLHKYEVDQGEANIFDENADSVRIMSIHKSKGLEFPVTIVAGFGKRFNMQDSSQAFLADDEYGIGMQYVDVQNRLQAKTLRRNILAMKNQKETLAEELRILYVAMTRAKEKLILTGVMDGVEERLLEEQLKQKLRKQNSLTPYEILSASTYWDFILPSIDVFDTSIVTFDTMELEDKKEKITQQVKLDFMQEMETYADHTIVDYFAEQFEFSYPHKHLEKLYTKTSVSELKKKAMQAETELGETLLFETEQRKDYVPRFCKEEKVSGVLRGNAVHKIMELIPFETIGTGRDDLVKFMEAEQKSGKLSKQYAELINISKIQTFLLSDIGQRVKEAAILGNVYKEQPFVYGVGASELDAQFPEDETILIQGIIDVFFEENGELVLLDYKTDRVENEEQLKERYRIQFDYYSKALEKMLNQKIKQRILYSFHLGYAIEL